MAAKNREAKVNEEPVAETRELVDVRLMKALSNKDRVRLLSVLCEKEASPNELSEYQNMALGKVSYHVKVLKDFKLIEMVGTEPRRGAVEHFYRAKQRAIFPEELWNKIPRAMRKGITRDVMGDALGDIGAATAGGTFDARKDSI